MKMELINSDGKLHAQNIETEELEPIPFGDIQTDSVDADTIDSVHYASSKSGATGGDKIQSALDEAALEPGRACIVVGPNGPDDVSSSSGSLPARESVAWKVNQTLEVPNNCVLRLRGSYLFLADATDSPLLTNSDHLGGFDISVSGIGNPILDGNARNQTTLGGDRISNQGVQFYDVQNLQIHGLTVRNTASWGLHVENWTNLTISNVEFDQDGTKSNQDGIHLTGPGQECEIQNITGGSDDDLVAVSGYDDADTTQQKSSGGSIKRVTINGVTAGDTGNGGAVRIYTAKDTVTRDVTVSNVVHHSNSNQCAVRVGSQHVTDPNPSDLLNIEISSVSVEASGGDGSGVVVESSAKNVTIDGLLVEGDASFGVFVRDWVYLKEFQLSNLIIDSLSGQRGITLQGTIDGLTITDSRFPGQQNVHIEVLSGTTINQFQLSNISVRPGFSVGECFSVHGTINGLALSDFSIQSCWNVFDFNGSVSGVISDVHLENSPANAVYVNHGGERYAGNVPKSDVRTFPNVERSRAYHDGSGTNTTGPAFCDGSAWISLVDGSTIS